MSALGSIRIVCRALGRQFGDRHMHRADGFLLVLFLAIGDAESHAQSQEDTPGREVDLTVPMAISSALKDAGCMHRDDRLVCGNVWVSAVLMPAFTATLMGSSTFRRQLAGVNRAPLHVAVMGPDHQSPSPDYNAVTELRIFSEGSAIAKIRIRRRSDISELLGHEFEHLSEWADGVLGRQSSAKSRFVVDSSRVVQAGKLVQSEVALHRHQSAITVAAR
jgi:hypothetical protein